jgi:hypothetical protein
MALARRRDRASRRARPHPPGRGGRGGRAPGPRRGAFHRAGAHLHQAPLGPRSAASDPADQQLHRRPHRHTVAVIWVWQPPTPDAMGRDGRARPHHGRRAILLRQFHGPRRRELRHALHLSHAGLRRALRRRCSSAFSPTPSACSAPPSSSRAPRSSPGARPSIAALPRQRVDPRRLRRRVHRSLRQTQRRRIDRHEDRHAIAGT